MKMRIDTRVFCYSLLTLLLGNNSYSQQTSPLNQNLTELVLPLNNDINIIENASNRSDTANDDAKGKTKESSVPSEDSGLTDKDKPSSPINEQLSDKNNTIDLLAYNSSASHSISQNNSRDNGYIIFLVHNAVVNFHNTPNITSRNSTNEVSTTDLPKSDSTSNSSLIENNPGIGMAFVPSLLEIPNNTQTMDEKSQNNPSNPFLEVIKHTYINVSNSSQTSAVEEAISNEQFDTSSTTNIGPEKSTSSDGNNGQKDTSNIGRPDIASVLNGIVPLTPDVSSMVTDTLSDVIIDAFATNPSLVLSLLQGSRSRRDTSDLGKVKTGENFKPDQIITKKNDTPLLFGPEFLSKMIHNATLIALSRFNSETEPKPNSTDLDKVNDANDETNTIPDEELETENDEVPGNVDNKELLDTFTQFIKLITAATLAAMIDPFDYE